MRWCIETIISTNACALWQTKSRSLSLFFVLCLSPVRFLFHIHTHSTQNFLQYNRQKIKILFVCCVQRRRRQRRKEEEWERETTEWQSRHGKFLAMPLARPVHFRYHASGKDTCTLIYEYCFIYGIIAFTDANRRFRRRCRSCILRKENCISLWNKNTNTSN